MAAVRWESAWRFSIVFAFLLVRHSNALSVSTEQPYTSNQSSDAKYESLDMAPQQGESIRSETGYTTRFFTTGDVDESFWLKHLGEDFKNAIHLQVGDGERCNGIFNMSENRPAYTIQHEPINNPVLENNVTLPPISAKQVEEKSKKKPGADGKKVRKSRRKSKSEQNIEKPVETVEKTKHPNAVDGQYAASNGVSYSEAPNQIQSQEEMKEHTKFQNINLKYAPEDNETDTKHNSTSLDNNTVADVSLEATPVVIVLPKSQKMIELETSGAPVVVKIPPVIYHSEPTTFPCENAYTDSTQTHSQTQTQNTPLASAEQQTDTDEQDATNMQYPTLTYEQQQNTCNQPDSQPTHTQYPVQMQAEQTQAATQHQHQHQQYSSAYVSSDYLNGISSSEQNQGVDPLVISAGPVAQQYNALESADIEKIHYMLSKRSVAVPTEAPLAEKDTPQTLAESADSEKSRVSRSNQELYQEGL